MKYAGAIANLLIGLTYTSYGFITLHESAPRWFRRQPVPHFALAWLAMTFTCGPHHLAHGLHTLLGSRATGGWEFAAVAVGAPAGVGWFLLRIEALRGGPGDRPIQGTPRWLRLLGVVTVLSSVALVVGLLVRLTGGGTFDPRYTPNLLLIVLYVAIGYYLWVGQLANRRANGWWSLSGLALTVVFPTCAVMHAAWVTYAVTGVYGVDVHGRVIDWLSVPAAIYFVWVVRAIAIGLLRQDDGPVLPVPRWLAVPVAA